MKALNAAFQKVDVVRIGNQWNVEQHGAGLLISAGVCRFLGLWFQGQQIGAQIGLFMFYPQFPSQVIPVGLDRPGRDAQILPNRSGGLPPANAVGNAQFPFGKEPGKRRKACPQGPDEFENLEAKSPDSLFGFRARCQGIDQWNHKRGRVAQQIVFQSSPVSGTGLKKALEMAVFLFKHEGLAEENLLPPFEGIQIG
jgi:hypothetical protein